MKHKRDEKGVNK